MGAGFFQFGAFAKAAEDAHTPGASAAGGVDVYSGVADHQAVGGGKTQAGSGKLNGLGVRLQAARILGGASNFYAHGDGGELLQKSVNVAAAAGGDQANAVGGVQFSYHLGNARHWMEAGRGAPSFFQAKKGLIQMQHIKQGNHGVAWGFDSHDDAARQAGSVVAGNGTQPLRQTVYDYVVGVNEGAVQVEEDGFDGGREEAIHAGGEIVNG